MANIIGLIGNKLSSNHARQGRGLCRAEEESKDWNKTINTEHAKIWKNQNEKACREKKNEKRKVPK